MTGFICGSKFTDFMLGLRSRKAKLAVPGGDFDVKYLNFFPFHRIWRRLLSLPKVKDTVLMGRCDIAVLMWSTEKAAHGMILKTGPSKTKDSKSTTSLRGIHFRPLLLDCFSLSQHVRLCIKELVTRPISENRWCPCIVTRGIKRCNRAEIVDLLWRSIRPHSFQWPIFALHFCSA
jgi:hypothetical protein